MSFQEFQKDFNTYISLAYLGKWGQNLAKAIGEQELQWLIQGNPFAIEICENESVPPAKYDIEI